MEQATTTTLTSALQNQFLSGGVLLMLVGAVMALFRRAPMDLWNWLKRRLIVSVDVMNSDPAFEWLSVWLDQHPYSQRATRLSLTTSRGTDTSLPKIVLTPAPGNHFFIYRHRLVWFNRERDHAGGGGKNDEAGMFSLLRRETYNIRIVGRSQEVVRSLIEDARVLAQSAAKAEAKIFTTSYGYWNELGHVPARALESIILPGVTTEKIVADLKEFLGARDWYNERGIPYRRGYLFYGVPGAGKSSIIGAIAAHLGLHLYVLNINSVSSDEALSSLMSCVKDNSLILLEDIDAAVSGRELKPGEDSERGISFSGLLNALDGVAAREGCLVFMTTNHIERLDPALIRPGRVDVKIHFDYATHEQIERMFLRFFSDHPAWMAAEFADALRGRTISMAEVQQHFLKYKSDAEEVLSRAYEIGAFVQTDNLSNLTPRPEDAGAPHPAPASPVKPDKHIEQSDLP